MRAAWFLLGVLGCGGGGGDDVPMDAPIDAAPLCTHLQNLRVMRGKAFTFGTNGGRRFEGTVCIEGRTDLGCATPDIDAKFELCAPSMADFGLRFKALGYENSVILHGPGALTITEEYAVGDDNYVESTLWTPIGAPYPPDATHGNVAVNVFEQKPDGTLMPVELAQVATVPSNGLTVVYLGDDGRPAMTRTATSTAGVAIIGNVPVGDYDIQINSTALPNCVPLTGGYPSPDNSQDARIRVIGATTVGVAFKCSL